MRRFTSLLASVAPLTVVVSTGLAVAAAGAVSADPAPFALAASAISVPSGDPLSLIGQAPVDAAGQAVDAQVDVGGVWRSVGSDTVADDGSVDVDVPSYLGLLDYRVVVAGADTPIVSAEVSVVGTLKVDSPIQSTDTTETVSGQLPQAVARPVVLLSGAGESGDVRIDGASDDDGKVSFTKDTRVGEYLSLTAPAFTDGDVTIPAYTSPNVSPLHVNLPYVAVQGPHAVLRLPYCATVFVESSGQATLTIDPAALPAGLTFDGTSICGRASVAGVTVVPAVVTYANGDTATTTFRVFVDRQQAIVAPTASSVVTAQGGTRSSYISNDGRTVAFSGPPSVSGSESATSSDVFVRDSLTGVRTEISRAPDGSAADGDSYVSAMSNDGRFVAFTSFARNLLDVPGASRGSLLLWDRTTGLVTQALAPAANVRGDVSISTDGDIVFSSQSNNLVPGDASGHSDIFLWERATGTVRLVSATAAGDPADSDSSGPHISADGSVVMFTSFASDLVGGVSPSGVYSFDRATGVTTPVAKPAAWAKQTAVTGVSDDGRYALLTWQGLVARASIWDRTANSFQSIPMTLPNRIPGDTASVTVDGLSGNGRYVALEQRLSSPTAYTTDGVDLWRWDTVTNDFLRLDGSVGGVVDPDAGDADLSSDGRYASYISSTPALSIVRVDAGPGTAVPTAR